ncbi:MAG: copper-binding protein [Xanthobacteraceae bacterium]|nr:copper-binding protein [Xanthobacteraceae bacterium]PWB58204.1 MAG: RND transporter [Bradyrhizobiaceae bacterium]
MNKTILAILAGLWLAAAGPAAALAQGATADGQVMKIDESAGKLTLKHGPLKKLGMDEPMTMVFRARDPAMLKQVKVGDKVTFEADKINGQFTVTKIEKAR